MGSEGGFGYSDVYNMPVFLRKFYLKKLEEWKKKEKEQVEAASKGKGVSTPPTVPKRPAVGKK